MKPIGVEAVSCTRGIDTAAPERGAGTSASGGRSRRAGSPGRPVLLPGPCPCWPVPLLACALPGCALPGPDGRRRRLVATVRISVLPNPSLSFPTPHGTPSSALLHGPRRRAALRAGGRVGLRRAVHAQPADSDLRGGVGRAPLRSLAAGGGADRRRPDAPALRQAGLARSATGGVDRPRCGGGPSRRPPHRLRGNGHAQRTRGGDQAVSIGAAGRGAGPHGARHPCSGRGIARRHAGCRLPLSSDRRARPGRSRPLHRADGGRAPDRASPATTPTSGPVTTPASAPTSSRKSGGGRAFSDSWRRASGFPSCTRRTCTSSGPASTTPKSSNRPSRSRSASPTGTATRPRCWPGSWKRWEKGKHSAAKLPDRERRTREGRRSVEAVLG